jgi:hypothetical protein
MDPVQGSWTPFKGHGSFSGFQTLFSGVMRVLFISLLFFIVLSPLVCSAGEEGFDFGREPEIEQIRPKKPVQIKLMRLSGGKYTWEIRGDDPEEVIKADERLRKYLGTK